MDLGAVDLGAVETPEPIPTHHAANITPSQRHHPAILHLHSFEFFTFAIESSQDSSWLIPEIPDMFQMIVQISGLPNS